MRKLARAVLVGVAIGATLTSLAAPVMAQAPIVGRDNSIKVRPDNRPGPLTERQEARRKAAQELILSGKASPNEDGVITLGEDKYFEAAVTGVGQVFTILAEFGDDGSGKLGTIPGPLHNEIAEPDRDLDNSTHWAANFNRAYYRDLFFGDGETFADFYTKQSSGAYTVDGGVSKWVQVPGNASTYGDNTVEDFGGAWRFIEDSGNAWFDAQVDAGKSMAQIKAKLAEFDVWDRYDYDEDGNFDEPDGYLDHFQAVHAGEGEDAGGGAQGADAIWSHRWYVNATDFGLTGPTIDGTDVLFGGSEIGNTGYWIGDYTVEAENGGLGVFAHEFAHDLGLPDLYDTAGGENGTAFWSVMSLGSWLGHGEDDIGTTPDYMGPWEKLQLGWLDYEVVSQGEDGEFVLSPAARQVEDRAQAVIVDVPDQGVTTNYTSPAGGHAWWTSSADDLNTTITRSLDLSGVASATVKASAWYDIEAGFDFLYGEYSTDDGETWIQVGAPLDGSSKGHWKTIRYTGIPGGGEVLFRFRFQSDGGVHLANAFIDNITVKSGGSVLSVDDVESGAGDWTAEGGFKISTGTETVIGDRYYIVENRTYVGYDETLAEGPYQFSFAVTAPNKVQHFPFQDGLLVWMIDETYSDNNTIEHPGHGLALPVDARPAPFGYADGVGRPSNRRQPFDATFGLQATEAVTLYKEVIVGNGPNAHVELVPATAPVSAGIATFTDAVEDAYWASSNPLGSTLVAGHGVVVTVLSQVTGGIMSIEVTNPD